jgi:hypothetical protein
MEQRRRGLVGHPRVTICRAGNHTLEQTENAPHALHPIKSGDKMHFGSPGIGEAHFNATSNKGPYETFSSVHDELIRLAFTQLVLVRATGVNNPLLLAAPSKSRRHPVLSRVPNGDRW